jgi:hypothetical protein
MYYHCVYADATVVSAEGNKPNYYKKGCANRSSCIHAAAGIITRKGLQLCSWWKGAPIDRVVFAQVLLFQLKFTSSSECSTIPHE